MIFTIIILSAWLSYFPSFVCQAGLRLIISSSFLFTNQLSLCQLVEKKRKRADEPKAERKVGSESRSQRFHHLRLSDPFLSHISFFIHNSFHQRFVWALALWPLVRERNMKEKRRCDSLPLKQVFLGFFYLFFLTICQPRLCERVWGRGWR
jgi:hypothetical protein